METLPLTRSVCVPGCLSLQGDGLDASAKELLEAAAGDDVDLALM